MSIEKKRSPTPVSGPPILYIRHLTRNVNESHLREIFGGFGKVVNVEIAVDKVVNLPKGYAYIEYEKKRRCRAGTSVHGRRPT